jgi:hypothetical protein
MLKFYRCAAAVTPVKVIVLLLLPCCRHPPQPQGVYGMCTPHAGTYSSSREAEHGGRALTAAAAVPRLPPSRREERLVISSRAASM